MKRTSVLSSFVGALLLLVLACNGPGIITSTQLPLSGFDQITLRAPIDLHLTQDNNFFVEVVGDSFWTSRIDVDVIGNILEVNFTPDTTGTGLNDSTPIYDVDINVHLPVLTQVEVFSAARIQTTNRFQVDDLDLKVAGAAKIDFEADGDELAVDISGAGDVEVDIDATSLATNIQGAGKLEAQGAVRSQKIEITGAGEIQAFDLVSDSCEVKFLGAGDCEVSANTSLDVRITGAGVVYYKGSPSVSQTITGLGRVVDAN